MQDPLFMIHNSHLDHADQFAKRDPQLRILSKQSYQHEPALLKQLPAEMPGVYTLYGGRQIGKTTLVKQWMQLLLKSGVKPQSIAYFTGEVVVDHLSLIQQLQSYISNMPQDALQYVIIGEVTYIPNWDMGVKYIADAGLLENTVLLLTGSDSVITQEARMRFPGRRGRTHQVDFHLYSLTFLELLQLKKCIPNLEDLLVADELSETQHKEFYEQFNQYMQHGGYLTAINDFAKTQSIDKSIFVVYADWVRGDVIKHGKSNHHLREFFNAMIKRKNSQITWTALARDFSIEHHSTIAGYAELLANMDVVFVQQALLEDKLSGAPKKARKLNFTDPFIYHSINAWLNPCSNPYQQQVQQAVLDTNTISYLVESCVACHFQRWYPTYYIKAEGEVDVVYVDKKKFWPIEIKWTEQMRGKDLKQIQKYKNAIVLGKQLNNRLINATPSYPLPWYLAKKEYLLRR